MRPLSLSRITLTLRLLIVAMLFICHTLWANSLPPPTYFQLPTDQPNQIILTEEYGEADFPIGASAQSNIQRGKHWSGETLVPSVGYDDPPGTAWKRMAPAFTKNGWVIKMQTEAEATLYYRRGEIEAWAKMSFGDPKDCRYDIVELARQQRVLKLIPPAAKPESFTANEDIPYLKPLADFKLVSGGLGDSAFMVPLADAEEPQFIASHFHHRL